MITFSRKAFACVAACLVAFPVLLSSPIAAQAKVLNVGVFRGAPSTDPHWSSTIAIYEQMIAVFEPAVRFDANNKVIPWLVESWKLIDDTTLEFKVRRNVKFHDGSPLTAADIKFTNERARNVPNSAQPLTAYVRPISKMEIVDDHTLRIFTNGPSPTLLQLLASVMIISKKNGEGNTTGDYHNGKGVIGTGPYKFVSWKPNDRVELTKNDSYWGGKPLWDGVNFIGITNDSARIAALLSGDIDVAQGIPAQEVERLKKDTWIRVFDRPANRHVSLALDITPNALETGKLTGPNGEKLTTNPLADPKVREALKLAINVDAVVDRVYMGPAQASGQYLLEGMFGYLKDVPKWKANEERAKQLLQESGWAGKFKITVSTSDSAFRASAASAQAIAQFWTRIGVPTDVSITPQPVFLEQRAGRKLVAVLASWTNPAGTAEDIYMPVLHSRNTEKGFGTFNTVGYKNDELDARIEKGMTTNNADERRKLFEDAGRIALKDGAIIPLWNPSEPYATVKGLSYQTRADGLMMVDYVKKD